jgi:hypothetical protein
MKISIPVAMFVITGVCNAQGFPLKPGDWELTSKVPGTAEPFVTRFCLNNETWQKALTQDPACKVQNFSQNSKGATYVMDCSANTVQIKGSVEILFDGMEHMVAKASISMTTGGKTTSSQSTSDYRWKNSACSAADVNMKKK